MKLHSSRLRLTTPDGMVVCNSAESGRSMQRSTVAAEMFSYM
jgi:hypothetical protein